jgi:hypothetical protein
MVEAAILSLVTDNPASFDGVFDSVTYYAGAVREITQGGAHVSIDALGSPVTCFNSIRNLRRRGRHVQVGLMLAEHATPQIPMAQVIGHELEIYGSHGMQAWRYDAMLSMITAGKLDPDASLSPSLIDALQALMLVYDEEGLQAARAWLERTGYEWRLPWSHVDLEPADVVQIALDDGTLLNVRILETELGANLELAWKTVLEESSSYTVTAVPGGSLNYLPQVDPVSSEARLFLLDTPLNRDSDDALRAATGHYWAAAAYFDPPWRGAVLFSSDDGAVYVAADETLAAVALGVARTALPDTDLPVGGDGLDAASRCSIGTIARPSEKTSELGAFRLSSQLTARAARRRRYAEISVCSQADVRPAASRCWMPQASVSEAARPSDGTARTNVNEPSFNPYHNPSEVQDPGGSCNPERRPVRIRSTVLQVDY